MTNNAPLEAFAAVLEQQASVLNEFARVIKALDTTAPSAERTVMLTVDEAAEHLRVSRSTVYSLMASGELQSTRLGGRRLVPRVSLDQIGREKGA